MRVVALVSGGKDSCYNMMQCIAAGHEIVALANLKPREKDELDSYMYQTVGHMGIPFLAEAMEIPLFRKETKGTSVSVGKHYEPTETDEVEDLFELLKMVKNAIHIDAVAVGAILSDYQRIRVENVCSRLNLVTLAYLWRRDQCELLQEMIDCKVKAIIIKVAALGLDPHKHLGRTLQQVQGHLLAMALQYGLNVCGEGGEYETFTLDCPLFKRKIELDISETIIDSNDPIAPVGYLNFTKLRLVDKLDKRSVVVKNSLDYVSDLNCSTYNDLSDPDLSESELEMIEKRQITMDKIRRSSTATVLVDKLSQMDLEKFKLESLSVSLNNLEKQNASCAANSEKNPNCERTARPKLETQISNASFDCDVMLTPQVALFETIPIKVTPKIHRNRTGWAYIGGVQGYGETLEDGIKNAMTSLGELLQSIDYTTEHFCSITLGVRSMMQFTELNAIYIRYLPINNPPVRACVELALPENCYVIIDATCFKCPEKNGDVEVSEKRTMHVQGISHWAPANIGPYSQANRVGDIVHMAGQIGLIPGSMELIEGLKPQCKLALRHVSRIALAMGCTDQLRDVVQAICWVIHPALITECRRQWERCSNSALVQYVVCPKLPRGAAVEWSTWAHRHNKQFQYEETGCSVDDFTISIRSRWNYDNTVCAAICQLSTGSATSTTHLSDLSNENQRLKTKSLSTNMEQISKTLEYTVNKVLKNSQKNENSTLKLNIFYRVGYIDVISILEATNAVENLFEQNLVFTVVPVCNLQNYNTFLSICAVIYE